MQSFDFTLEKGVLGNYAGTGPLPAEDVHLKSPLTPLIRIRRSLGTQKTAIELTTEQTRAERRKLTRE